MPRTIIYRKPQIFVDQSVSTTTIYRRQVFADHFFCATAILLRTCLSRVQESTSSEDVSFFYAMMTMWAVATGNAALEGLGRIQTGIVCRSINAYFFYEGQQHQPPGRLRPQQGDGTEPMHVLRVMSKH